MIAGFVTTYSQPNPEWKLEKSWDIRFENDEIITSLNITVAVEKLYVLKQTTTNTPVIYKYSLGGEKIAEIILTNLNLQNIDKSSRIKVDSLGRIFYMHDDSRLNIYDAIGKHLGEAAFSGKKILDIALDPCKCSDSSITLFAAYKEKSPKDSERNFSEVGILKIDLRLGNEEKFEIHDVNKLKMTNDAPQLLSADCIDGKAELYVAGTMMSVIKITPYIMMVKNRNKFTGYINQTSANHIKCVLYKNGGKTFICLLDSRYQKLVFYSESGNCTKELDLISEFKTKQVELFAIDSSGNIYLLDSGTNAIIKLAMNTN